VDGGPVEPGGADGTAGAVLTLWVASWLALTALIWAALCVGVSGWGKKHELARVRSAHPLDVRVCVPARDEEGYVGRCVLALVANGPVEVVVVDDGSADRTAAEAAEAGAVVRAAARRPAGWSGKAWACQEAACGATTRWLLFVDADVVVAPDAISSLVAAAEARELALLSLFGTWEVVSFWERVALPAIGWFIRGAVQLDTLNANGPGAPAFANGQMILVDRDAYVAWGGHGAVRGEVLDDVRLAEVARGSGGRLGLLVAPWAFRVRLYDGLVSMFQGYRKNLYEGTGRRPALAIGGAVLVAATTVAPPLAVVPLWLAGEPWLALAAGGVWLEIAFYRWMLERRDGRSGWIAPLHPLGGLVLAAVLLASWRSRTVAWKGRVFVDGQVEKSEGPSEKTEGPSKSG
jgi:glycosyltransferase involved in cell wall biosynthesis